MFDIFIEISLWCGYARTDFSSTIAKSKYSKFKANIVNPGLLGLNKAALALLQYYSFLQNILFDFRSGSLNFHKLTNNF